mmetsp:Transcript_20680/g.39321  ORF Transcript_20680/g.39321 Transcript_20680/m.39321 type:complete len:221 (+) Transcript_20680:250-912(+)
MGLIKKIRIRKVGRRIKLPDSLPPPPPVDKEPDLYDAYSPLQVVSVPKEYSTANHGARFNWLTNEMDSFQNLSCGKSTSFDSQSEGFKIKDETTKPSKATTPNLRSDQLGWVSWFTSCFGTSATLQDNDLLEKISLASTEESDDCSGESSVPSCSREGQVLQLRKNKSIVDDVSDITSVPSEDESESDDDSDDFSTEVETVQRIPKPESVEFCSIFGRRT